jgi:UMF1 family MFS transporter
MAVAAASSASVTAAPKTYPPRSAVISWMFFDWAAQPYFSLITTFVFAPYFATRVASDAAIADASGRRKPWIASFGAIFVIGACIMWIGKPGDPAIILPLLIAYGLATIGVEFATVFNNAMMPTLVPPDKIGRLSGSGWALGYVGGILSLIIVLGFMAANPTTGRTLFGLVPILGLDPATFQGDRISAPLSGLWFVVFVLPMFLLTPDFPAKVSPGHAVRAGLTDLRHTLSDLPKHRSMMAFLIANMIYTDGLVSLFAFGGIYAAGTFGWNTIQIGTFGIILAIAGTFGAFIGGKLDDALGPKRVITGSILLLLTSIIAILLIDRETIFFFKVTPPVPGGGLFAAPAEKAYLLLGCLIGMAGGPLQAASRTLLIRLAPQDRIAQFFGLFALTGKVTSFMGPLLIGFVTAVTASQKAGMAVLVLFFVGGLGLLARVREA